MQLDNSDNYKSTLVINNPPPKIKDKSWHLIASYDNTPPTGSGIGNREQLLDLTTVLAPRQAPVYGLLPKQAATADLVEYTVDNLRTPNANNAVEEGIECW